MPEILFSENEVKIIRRQQTIQELIQLEKIEVVNF
jgi:hypothetical protein